MNRVDFDLELHDGIDPYTGEYVPPDSFDRYPSAHGQEPSLEHPFADLKKMLSDGTFYYSVDCDLTNRLQDR